MITKRRKKKRSFQEVFLSVLFSFFALAIIALLVVSNFKIREKRKEILSQIEFLEKEIQNLEKKNQEMKAGISETGTEEYQEEKIREQGYKKPGEEVVAIKKIQTEEKPTEQKKEEKSLWQKFLEILRIK